MTPGFYTAAGSTAATEIDPAWHRQIPQTTRAKNQAEAVKIGKDFEQMFLSQMLQPMFEGIGEGPFSGGYGEKMFKSMQIDEYAKALTNSGGIGIANAVTREILRLQEKANG
jgi:Rod binding domain-containing protein